MYVLVSIIILIRVVSVLNHCTVSVSQCVYHGASGSISVAMSRSLIKGCISNVPCIPKLPMTIYRIHSTLVYSHLPPIKSHKEFLL